LLPTLLQRVTASFQMQAGAGGVPLQAPLQSLAAMLPQMAAQMQGGAKPMQLAAQPGVFLPLAANPFPAGLRGLSEDQCCA